MWWSFRKSKRIGKRSRLTLSKSGVGGSTGTKHARVSVGRRGARASFSLFGIRIGGKLW
jgi:hypothetical protein